MCMWIKYKKTFPTDLTTELMGHTEFRKWDIPFCSWVQSKHFQADLWILIFIHEWHH